MRAILGRIWAGIVSAVVGACLGFVLTIILVMMRYPLDFGLWSVVILSGLGFVLGALIGNRKIR
ncbi:unnamed protein product [uncultured bacterium]|nr:unnamed protein product [uncultured bacterium]